MVPTSPAWRDTLQRCRRALGQHSFLSDLQPVAAFVADLLCDQVGVTLSLLEPTTTFTIDLRMDDLEPVELVMALEEELGIQIPDADCGDLNTISSLVAYLHARLDSDRHNSQAPNPQS